MAASTTFSPGLGAVPATLVELSVSCSISDDVDDALDVLVQRIDESTAGIDVWSVGETEPPVDGETEHPVDGETEHPVDDQAEPANLPTPQSPPKNQSKKLIDADVFSKSDPMCVLFTQEPGSTTWREFGRTEIIWNNLNPDFVKKFNMHYFFEESQKLLFQVYDVDSKSANLDKHDFLGKMECTLAEIVTTSRFSKRLRFDSGKKNNGQIIVSAEEVSTCKTEMHLQMSGHNLDKKDFFGKSDPFLTFFKSNEDTSFTVVHRTEVIKRTLNPTWRPFKLSNRAICNGDYDRTIKVECHDWDADGGHDLIGEFYTSARQLMKGKCPENVYEVISPKKKRKKGNKYKNSGTVDVLFCKTETIHTFLDYVKGGTELHCTFAVDFTASNGNPANPASLHYLSPYSLNPYSNALSSVGNIIQDYDTDKLFPALGFGAKLPPDGRVSHEFFLNGKPNDPYCQGIQGVLDAYYSSLRSVQLYGPTNFAPVINHVARFASTRRNGEDYFILLILTDGIITDMPQTMEAIVNAASLPMSIIIIGIGDADFEAMEILDGDEVRVSFRGREAERDIVQFVPMRDFIQRSTENSQSLQARLAKEVLAEIPDQFLSYMRKCNVKPKPPLQRQSTISSISSLPISEY